MGPLQAVEGMWSGDDLAPCPVKWVVGGGPEAA